MEKDELERRIEVEFKSAIEHAKMCARRVRRDNIESDAASASQAYMAVAQLGQLLLNIKQTF